MREPPFTKGVSLTIRQVRKRYPLPDTGGTKTLYVGVSLNLRMLEFFIPFIFGSVLGSFLNVCIHRLPSGESIVRPPSRCPACKRHIPFYDNIPLASYILLGGRCRFCGASIPVQYPVVELLTGVLCVVFLRLDGLTPLFFVHIAFVCALVVATFIDLRHMVIPDVITLPGMVVGLSVSFFLPVPGVLNSLIGVVAGGGILFLIAYLYYSLSGREGMGGGDIKLLGMIGAFVGWKGVIVTLIVGSFAGAVVGGIFMVLAGKDTRYAIPFGPFLSAGALVYLLTGDALIRLYLSMTLPAG